MNCPNCSTPLKKVKVKIEDVKERVLSFQCPRCDYFEFDKEQITKAISELQHPPLQIKQTIVKLSNHRLGMYFNKNIIESLGLKAGEEIALSVPDRKHIVLSLKEEQTKPI